MFGFAHVIRFINCTVPSSNSIISTLLPILFSIANKYLFTLLIEINRRKTLLKTLVLTIFFLFNEKTMAKYLSAKRNTLRVIKNTRVCDLEILQTPNKSEEINI